MAKWRTPAWRDRRQRRGWMARKLYLQHLRRVCRLVDFTLRHQRSMMALEKIARRRDAVLVPDGLHSLIRASSGVTPTFCKDSADGRA